MHLGLVGGGVEFHGDVVAADLRSAEFCAGEVRSREVCAREVCHAEIRSGKICPRFDLVALDFQAGNLTNQLADAEGWLSAVDRLRPDQQDSQKGRQGMSGCVTPVAAY